MRARHASPLLDMISHRHRCIYLKVPKCASSSLLQWFLANAGGYPSHPQYWHRGPLPLRIQWTARAIELYPDYFTFTFLRDPHARFLSLYRAAERVCAQRAGYIPGHPPSVGTLEEFSVLCEQLLADSRGLWGRESNAFVYDKASRRYGPLGIELRHLWFVFNHVRPQADFLPGGNPERLLGVQRLNPSPLGFIGRVETIEQDFARLQKLLALPRLPLPCSNASERSLEPLYDDATRERVGQLYAEDLALLAALPREDLSTPARMAVGPTDTRMLMRRTLLRTFTGLLRVEQHLSEARGWPRILSPLARMRRRLW